MKGKRYTTEDKIRILREGDRGKSILEVCRAHNISEVSFHRWKRQFGQMDLNEARKLKELERENSELKKMLAEHTRECHVLRPERALRAADVLAWLERAIQEHGAPSFLRSAATTDRSSSPKRCNAGWPTMRSRRSTSTRAAPGKTASSRASTDASVTSASTRSNSGRSPKLAWSSPTSASTTTTLDRTASSATKARCALRDRTNVLLRSSKLDKITQPNYKQTSPRTNSPSGSEKWVSSI